MSNVIDVAISGMRAAQKGMLITSNNVANSTDENYSRRQLNLSTAEGGGVQVGEVTHFADRSLQVRQLDSTSNYNYGQLWADMANDTEDYMALASLGFKDASNNFYTSFDNLASSPNDTEAKSASYAALEAMALSTQSVADHFQNKKSATAELLAVEIDSVNNLAHNIASSNEQIRASQSAEQKLNLINERDGLLKQLAEIADVRSVELNNGEVDVYLGDGISLVARSYQQTLSIQPNNENNSFNILLGERDISDKISGGKIDGIISAFNQFVQPAVNKSGQHAFALTASLNEVYRGWVDDDGNQLGQSPLPAFSTVSVSREVAGIDDNGNGAAIVFSATVDTNSYPPADLGALPQEILIKKTAAGYDVINKRTGELIGSANTFATPITVNGIALSSLPSGVEMQEGESVTILPFVNANSEFKPVFNSGFGMSWGDVEQTVELANKIAEMADGKILNNGQESLKTNNPFVDNELIALSRRTKTALEFDQTSLELINQQIISGKGVSLDEEAANQLRYQELYEVSAQLVKTSQKMFSTLMDALR